MQIISSLDKLPTGRCRVVTIGSFDGVHLGHQQVLRQLRDMAQQRNMESVVVTFDPHPRLLLHPSLDFFMINSFEQKICLLEKEKVDYLLILPFTLQFAELQYDQFIRNIIIEQIGAQAIIMGTNHSFGKDREGNYQKVKDLCAEYGVDVIQIKECLWNDIAVRSTHIRRAILKNDYKKTEELLGHALFLKQEKI